MMRDDERLVLRTDVLDEFPEGVPSWMDPLPVEEVRRLMALRREGYTMLGRDPADDYLDREPLRVVH